jgi:hypothetical protein
MVSVTEQADGTLLFELEVVGPRAADLRGLFFDVNDPTLLGNLVLTGPDITAYDFEDVMDLGYGNNMLGGGREAYDVGMSFGDAGIGSDKEDIRSTSFVLSSADGSPLTLDLIANVEFGVRLTSIGTEGGARDGSSKQTVVAPAAPDAIDDNYTTPEDTPITIDPLANDTDADGDALTATVLTGPAHGTLSQNPDGTYEYTPDPDYNGSDSFTYQVDDGKGGVDHATVYITVDPVNDAPVARDDAFTGDEDVPIVGNVLVDNGNGPDFDIDGDALTVVAGVFSTAAGGSVTIATDGSFTYTPAANYFGTDSFDYTLQDGNGGEDTGTVTLTLRPDDLAPVAFNDNYLVRENQTLTVAAAGFLFNDLDPEGGAVTATLITDGVDNGTLSAFPDGRFTYTPDAGFSGVDSFTYRMRDVEGNTAEATVFITVLENLPPVALDDSYAVAEGQTLNVAAAGFLVNDLDPEGGVVTAVLITDGVDNGTLTAFPDGRFTYTPDAGFSGTDSFTYRMRDADGKTAEATVVINVLENRPPVAMDDSYLVGEGQTLSIAAAGFLTNDYDPEGGSVSAVLITDGVDNGTLTAFPDGKFTYTPDAGFSGTDSFTYRMRDDAGKTAEATVFITVLDNLPPVALDDSYAVAAGGTLNIAAAGFLTNDLDPEGSAVSAVLITDGVDNGTLTAFPDGKFTYAPNAGFTGVDSFTYRMRDADNNTAEATVFITVAAAGDPLIAQDDNYLAREGEALDIAAAGFLTNDLDPEGGAVTATVITDGVDNGTLSAFADGRFTYTPNAGFTGVDSFTYRIRDADNNTAEATVFITVLGNLPPVTLDDSYVVAEGETLTVDAAGFLTNDADPEGGAVTATVITDGVDNGALSAFADGRFVYTPNAGFTGVDSFSYRARDDAGKTSEATVFITVLENLPPVVLDDSYAVTAGETLTVDAAGFLANDLDPEGGAVTATVITDGVDNGSLSAFADGRFVYTPNPGFAGTDSFSYRARDDAGKTAEATVFITVLENLPPVALDDSYSVAEGGALNVAAAFGFLQNDADPEGGPVTATTITDNVDNGTLSAFANGSFNYTPNPGFVGTDSFVYRVRDDDQNFSEATVTINVIGTQADAAAVDADAPV